MDKKKKKKLVIPVILVMIMAGAIMYSQSGEEDTSLLDSAHSTVSGKTDEMIVKTDDSGSDTGNGEYIYVDVGGAVNDPQVVRIAEGSRVFQAIEEAGGTREDADLRTVNLAAVCDDGQKITVPSEEDLVSSSSVSGDSLAAGDTGGSNGLVNINTAGTDELQTLTGVGPGIAQRIIDYRASAGNFHSIEDIKNVSGIGEKTFEKMKDHICV